MADSLLENYNPLYDVHLRQYFALPHMQKHLRRMGLIDANGQMVDGQDAVYARHNVMMDMMLKNREQQLTKLAELQKKLDAAEKVEIYRRIRSGQSPESFRRTKASRSLSRGRPRESTGARQRRFSNSFSDKELITKIESKDEPEKINERDPYARLSAKASKYRYLHKLDDKTLVDYQEQLRRELDRLERFRALSFGVHSVARHPPSTGQSWFFRRRSLPSLTQSAPAASLHEPLRSVNSLRGRKQKTSPHRIANDSCPPTVRQRRSSNSANPRLPPIQRKHVSKSAAHAASTSPKPIRLPPAHPKPSTRPTPARSTSTKTAKRDKLPALEAVGVGIGMTAAAASTALIGSNIRKSPPKAHSPPAEPHDLPADEGADNDNCKFFDNGENRADSHASNRTFEAEETGNETEDTEQSYETDFEHTDGSHVGEYSDEVREKTPEVEDVDTPRSPTEKPIVVDASFHLSDDEMHSSVTLNKDAEEEPAEHHISAEPEISEHHEETEDHVREKRAASIEPVEEVHGDLVEEAKPSTAGDSVISSSPEYTTEDEAQEQSITERPDEGEPYDVLHHAVHKRVLEESEPIAVDSGLNASHDESRFSESQVDEEDQIHKQEIQSVHEIPTAYVQPVQFTPDDDGARESLHSSHGGEEQQNDAHHEEAEFAHESPVESNDIDEPHKQIESRGSLHSSNAAYGEQPDAQHDNESVHESPLPEGEVHEHERTPSQGGERLHNDEDAKDESLNDESHVPDEHDDESHQMTVVSEGKEPAELSYAEPSGDEEDHENEEKVHERSPTPIEEHFDNHDHHEHSEHELPVEHDNEFAKVVHETPEARDHEDVSEHTYSEHEVHDEPAREDSDHEHNSETLHAEHSDSHHIDEDGAIHETEAHSPTENNSIHESSIHEHEDRPSSNAHESVHEEYHAEAEDNAEVVSPVGHQDSKPATPVEKADDDHSHANTESIIEHDAEINGDELMTQSIYEPVETSPPKSSSPVDFSVIGPSAEEHDDAPVHHDIAAIGLREEDFEIEGQPHFEPEPEPERVLDESEFPEENMHGDDVQFDEHTTGHESNELASESNTAPHDHEHTSPVGEEQHALPGSPIAGEIVEHAVAHSYHELQDAAISARTDKSDADQDMHEESPKPTSPTELSYDGVEVKPEIPVEDHNKTPSPAASPEVEHQAEIPVNDIHEIESIHNPQNDEDTKQSETPEIVSGAHDVETIDEVKSAESKASHDEVAQKSDEHEKSATPEQEIHEKIPSPEQNEPKTTTSPEHESHESVTTSQQEVHEEHHSVEAATPNEAAPLSPLQTSVAHHDDHSDVLSEPPSSRRSPVEVSYDADTENQAPVLHEAPEYHGSPMSQGNDDEHELSDRALGVPEILETAASERGLGSEDNLSTDSMIIHHQDDTDDLDDEKPIGDIQIQHISHNDENGNAEKEQTPVQEKLNSENDNQYNFNTTTTHQELDNGHTIIHTETHESHHSISRHSPTDLGSPRISPTMEQSSL